jgi:hypothetical protein
LLHEAPTAMTCVHIAARTLETPNSEIRNIANELAAAGLVRVTADLLELEPTSIEGRLAIVELAEWHAQERECILNVLRALGRRATGHP